MDISIKNAIKKYLEGSADDKEKTILFGWLKKSEENTRFFLEMKDLFFLEKNVEALSKFDSDKAYNEFIQRKGVQKKAMLRLKFVGIVVFFVALFLVCLMLI